jgi:glutamine---fructose-6-phosphate transaminase (isomerizing)
MKLSVTKSERPPATAIARDIREIPSAARRLLARQAVVSAIADRIHAATPRVVVTCGRGSSGHVGVYLR